MSQMRKNRNRKLPYFNSFTRADGVLGLTMEIGKLEGRWWCSFQKRIKGKTLGRLFFFFFFSTRQWPTLMLPILSLLPFVFTVLCVRTLELHRLILASKMV